MKVKINRPVDDPRPICLDNVPKPISISFVREEGDESQNVWVKYAEIFRELMDSGETSFFASESIGWLQDNNDFSPLIISLYCDENDYTKLSEYVDNLPTLAVIGASVAYECNDAKINANFLSRIESIERKLDDKWNRTFFIKRLPDKTHVSEKFGQPENK